MEAAPAKAGLWKAHGPPPPGTRGSPHKLSPAASRVRARPVTDFPDEEVEQVPFLPLIDDRLSGLVGPADHLDGRRGIVRHEVDDAPDLDPREQLVQLREDRGTLDADFEHLVIGECCEAPDTQRGDLFRETVVRVPCRPQRPAVLLEVRRLQASEPSGIVGGVGQRPRLRQYGGVDLAEDSPKGRADRPEVFPALEESDRGIPRIRGGEWFRGDFRDRPRECRVDARDAHDHLSGFEETCPHESLRVVQKVVRELAVFDLHGVRSSRTRTSARRSSASPSDRTLSSDSSRSVTAPRDGTSSSFTRTGPPPSTDR